MPGGYNEKGPRCIFPLLLLLCSQHLPLGMLTGRILNKAFSTPHGTILALTCTFGSHSDGFRVQTLYVLRMIQTKIANGIRLTASAVSEEMVYLPVLSVWQDIDPFFFLQLMGKNQDFHYL